MKIAASRNYNNFSNRVIKKISSRGGADSGSPGIKKQIRVLQSMVDEWEVNGGREDEMTEGMSLVQNMIDELRAQVNFQEKWREESAMETGMAHGIQGYNEAMGVEVQDPDEFDPDEFENEESEIAERARRTGYPIGHPDSTFHI